MLNKYRYKEKDFYFSSQDKNQGQNAFTVIVGKNGTGKSRLMKSIIESFVGKSGSNGFLRLLKNNKKSMSEINKNGIYIDELPKKIIAVSTSPFDKFPLDPFKRVKEGYVYLGLRDLRSRDLGMAYMANIYTSLLKSVATESGRTDKVCEVLGFLGYSPRIEADFNFLFSAKLIRDTLESSDPIDFFVKKISLDDDNMQRHRYRGFFDEYESISEGLSEIRKVDIYKVKKFIDVCKKINLPNLKYKVKVLLEKSGLYFSNDDFYDLDDFFFLAEIGVVKLKTLNLEKDNGNSYSIGDASSGEQSVVMSILGIASQICDGSLIFIDEPEVCLHPEWQEKYIGMLINTFKSFKGCHFIIATHSPLMVSKLKDDNCYLMKMESGEVTNAEKINNKSVDFQLVNTFGTPGFKNEYLTRELISILSLFGGNGELDAATQDKLKFFLSLKDQISEKDPVLKLMDMAQEALLENM